MQPLPQNRVSLLSLRSHPFFADTPLPPPSPSFSSSSHSSSSISSRSTSLANASTLYHLMGAVSQDMINTPSTVSSTSSAHGGASTPSTAPRARAFSSRAGKHEQEQRDAMADGGKVGSLHYDLSSALPLSPLDPSLRVMPTSPPSSPLLSITCTFGCISL